YADVWGLQRVEADRGAVFLRGSSPEHFILSLHRRNTRGLHHIGYALRSQDAVLRAASELKQAGVRIIRDPGAFEEPGGGFCLRFVAPEGRCIELSANVSNHADGWAKKTIEPQSICHIVNNTPNLEQITAFYTETLGFRVSDWSGEQMAFLRTESKHHNIA